MTYYNKEYPKIDDTVFVTVNKYSENGTYCHLLEYNNIEGLILNTELDRWSRDDKRPLRINDGKKFKYDTIYCARVIRINDNKTVDLSYKSIDINLREKLIDSFNYIQKIKILCDELSFLTNLNKETVYSLTIRSFDFEKSTPKDQYFNFLKSPEVFVQNFKESFPLESEMFIKNMKDRVTFTQMTIEQPFELLIYDTDAISKLQDILLYDDLNENENESTTKIGVECISSPKYKIIVSSYTLEEANEKITKCFEILKKRSQKYKSSIKLLTRKNTDGKDDVDGIIKHQEIYVRRVNMQNNN